MAKTPLPADSRQAAPDGERSSVSYVRPPAVGEEAATNPPSTIISWTSDTAVPGLNPPELRPPEFRPPPPVVRPPGPVVMPLLRPIPARALQPHPQVRPSVIRKPLEWARGFATVALLTLVFGGIVLWANYFLHRAAPPELPDRPATDPVLSANQAFSHVGEHVRVEFKVRAIRFSAPPAQSLYLYASADSPNGELCVVITPEVLAELGERRPLQVDALEGAVIRVNGLIYRERQFAAIDINTFDQLEKFPGLR